MERRYDGFELLKGVCRGYGGREWVLEARGRVERRADDGRRRVENE